MSAHHAGEDILLLQRVLQRQRIDHRGQHAHVIGGDAVHLLGLLGHAAEEVSAAHHDGDLDAQAVHIGELGRDLVHALIVDTKALAGGQSLAGNFQKNAFVNRSSPCVSRYPWRLTIPV